MSSTTGHVSNNSGVTLTFTVGTVHHGANPEILKKTLDNGTSGDVFIAHSDGAGVEGTVIAAGDSVSFTLGYDNPVVGNNSCKADASGGCTGTCEAGSGSNNTVKYDLQCG